MIPIISTIIAIIVTGAIGLFLGKILAEKKIKTTHGNAKDQSKQLIENAENEANSLKQKTIIENKELILKTKNELDKDYQEYQSKIREKDKRLTRREQRIQKIDDDLKDRGKFLLKKENEVTKKEELAENNWIKANNTLENVKLELENIAKMTQSEARVLLEEKVIVNAKISAEEKIKIIEKETKEKLDSIVKNILVTAIQRYASDYVSERTVSVIPLPNDEMKGRIIGREGRNIRAFEATTGVDVIIDDTPDAVILSCFNPIRREIGKMALTNLIKDGRIHPTRIEEVVAKCEDDLNIYFKRTGEQVAFDMGLQRIHPELLYLIGTLKFRSSYSQNLLNHSIEVGHLAGMIASELGLNAKHARRAGLLHDIGKTVDQQEEGSHAIAGAALIKKYGENNQIIRAVASHHNDVRPQSLLDQIIQIANTLSAQRPGARKEFYASYIKRLGDLEKLCKTFPQVKKAYAIQAGREIRVMVENQNIRDDGVLILVKDIANSIENHLAYPGQIKVNVIRETRSVHYAK
jgi:ribonucrease Y